MSCNYCKKDLTEFIRYDDGCMISFCSIDCLDDYVDSKIVELFEPQWRKTDIKK